MDRGAWWYTVHGIAKGRTWLSNYHVFHFPPLVPVSLWFLLYVFCCRRSFLGGFCHFHRWLFFWQLWFCWVHKRRWAEALSALPSWPNPTHKVNLRCNLTFLSDVQSLIYSFMNQILGNSKRSSWEALSIRLFTEFVKKKWHVGGREDILREPWSLLQKKKNPALSFLIWKNSLSQQWSNIRPPLSYTNVLFHWHDDLRLDPRMHTNYHFSEF